MSACHRCRDSGYLADKAWCTCPARPFGPASPERDAGERAPIPVLTKREALLADVASIADRAEITICIDDVLRWSSTTLGELVALGQWITYLEAGGRVDVVVRHVLGCLDRLDQPVAELPGLIDRVRFHATEATGAAA